MIGLLIACDHAERRLGGHLPTGAGLQSLYGFGDLTVPPAGGGSGRHGRAARSAAPRRGRAASPCGGVAR